MSVLNDEDIRALIKDGHISSSQRGNLDKHIQPASLDLSLGQTAYRLRASFLPNDKRISDCLSAPLLMHKLDISQGAVLEVGCVYLVPLAEILDLPTDISARANPKSSTGRVDVFVRLVTDYGTCFDDVPAGYSGPIYAEISPRTFSILVHSDLELLQLRFRKGAFKPLRELVLSADLSSNSYDIIGYRARRYCGLIDMTQKNTHNWQDFWEPIYSGAGQLVLDPGEFYILASNEAVEIALDEAAEMAPIAPELGEFRAHYAGFFDPGFGIQGGAAKAVLEVRSRDVPFIIDHGQPVARLVFEPMTAPPEHAYGEIGSHYQAQGLKLSKHFIMDKYIKA